MGKEKLRFKIGDKIYRPGFTSEYIINGISKTYYNIEEINNKSENGILKFDVAENFRLLSGKGVKYNKKKLTINGKSTNK